MCLIKFCGFTRLEDCSAAVEAGAELLGFNFYPPSPRSISPPVCRQMIVDLKPIIEKTSRRIVLVGVFVNQPADFIRAIISDCGLDLAQLSGDEDPELLRELGDLAFKAVRLPADGNTDGILTRFPPRGAAPALLVDGGKAGQYGGTGLTADWSASAQLARQAPILLAGGLTPMNVADAVRQVHPWGVDTASGIESAPGLKDRQKMIEFCQAVRSVTEREK